MCVDQSVLGRAFYLMGFVEGWSPMGVDNARSVRYRPRCSGGLAYQLAEGIALLSKVDWRAKGLDDLGRPDGFHDRQVDRWTAFFERIKGRELPGLEVATNWLREHRPLDYIPGLMHGDYQFANVMYRHGAPARLAAIVDWEMGTVGDPKLDLAWMVQGWPEDTHGPEAATSSYVDMTGMPTRSQVLAHYSEVSGRQVEDIDYYVILAKWKLAIVLEQGFQRAGDDEKLLAFGPIVVDLMQRRGRTRRNDRLQGMTDDELVRERRGSVLVARLNRPAARNALSPSLMSAIGAALLDGENDHDIGAVVLTGSGDRAFCAGMDLQQFSDGEEMVPSDDRAAQAFYRFLRGDVGVPVVGAANATAVAGGFELLLGCDVIVASSEAKFGLPEVKRGLFPAGGGTLLGTRIPLVSHSRWSSPATASAPTGPMRSGSSMPLVAPDEVLGTVVSLRSGSRPTARSAWLRPRSSSVSAWSTPTAPRSGSVICRPGVFASQDAREAHWPSSRSGRRSGRDTETTASVAATEGSRSMFVARTARSAGRRRLHLARRILSISSSSSEENSRASMVATFCSSWSTLLAPIRVEVTRVAE